MMSGSFLDTVVSSSESLADKRAKKVEERKKFMKPAIDEVEICHNTLVPSLFFMTWYLLWLSLDRICFWAPADFFVGLMFLCESQLRTWHTEIERDRMRLTMFLDH